MAKLKSPLTSLNASGRLTEALTFVRRRFTNIVERTPKPKDAKTFAQLSWRHMFEKAVALWWALSAAEKQEWESLARPKHMIGFAYFISLALKPNPGLYLPLQGGKMAGDIDMDGNKIEDLPDPTAAQDPVTRQYFEDNLPSGGYTEGARVYHNVTLAVPNNAWYYIPFNSERYDTDVIHDNAVNNSRLTCKTAGKYLIIAQAFFETNATGWRQGNIFLNHTSQIINTRTDATAACGVNINLATVWNLALTDYVEFAIWQNSGAALDIYYTTPYATEFMMQRIG